MVNLSIYRRPGSEWALEQAKYNLVNHYFLVGVTEEMEDFIYLLELSLPRLVNNLNLYRSINQFPIWFLNLSCFSTIWIFYRIFKGSMNQYLNSSKSHLRQTTSKIDPQPETIAEIKKTDVWKLENEFYEFALQQFHFTYKLQNNIKVQGNSLTQKYFYEKIRPKSWSDLIYKQKQQNFVFYFPFTGESVEWHIPRNTYSHW